MTTLMEQEMAQQADVLNRLTARFDKDVSAVSDLVGDDVSTVVFIARGSSDNAAILGRYAAELATGRPAALGAPSLTTRYQKPRNCRGVLAVGLSQSGQTPEITTTLEAMSAAGARTIAVTNDGSSPLADCADLVLPLEAGAERAVPATKTVTAQMLTVLSVAAGLGPLPMTRAALDQLPGQVHEALADPEPAFDLAQHWAEHATLLAVARGFLLPAACETALKIRETVGITAIGTSSADLLHGPIAAVHPGAAVLLFDGDPATTSDIADLRVRLRKIGADVADVAPGATATLSTPPLASALLAPIVAVARGQQLALALAAAHGLNPDSPTGLNKVTVST